MNLCVERVGLHIREEKFLGNLSRYGPSSLYHGARTPGAGPPVLGVFGSGKERTLERNHSLPGKSYDCTWVWVWGRMPNPNNNPQSPRGGRDPWGKGREALGRRR